ncbi:GATA zinc finger domain-containing protein 14-like [Mytilus californianus]|uniref:GATA zinc finger domain-containing protein 14-like n=1 Tax=Mytilus californianus TaxID=6549 RepID=UPI002245904F|nr:GATA zinc finger domain-containing protein 14-like [Mytilus californianus]
MLVTICYQLILSNIVLYSGINGQSQHVIETITLPWNINKQHKNGPKSLEEPKPIHIRRSGHDLSGQPTINPLGETIAIVDQSMVKRIPDNMTEKNIIDLLNSPMLKMTPENSSKKNVVDNINMSVMEQINGKIIQKTTADTKQVSIVPPMVSQIPSKSISAVMRHHEISSDHNTQQRDSEKASDVAWVPNPNIQQNDHVSEAEHRVGMKNHTLQRNKSFARHIQHHLVNQTKLMNPNESIMKPEMKVNKVDANKPIVIAASLDRIHDSVFQNQNSEHDVIAQDNKTLNKTLSRKNPISNIPSQLNDNSASLLKIISPNFFSKHPQQGLPMQIFTVPSNVSGDLPFKYNFSNTHTNSQFTNFNMSWDAGGVKFHSSDKSHQQEKQERHRTVNRGKDVLAFSDKSENSNDKQTTKSLNQNSDSSRLLASKSSVQVNTNERSRRVSSSDVHSFIRHNKTDQTNEAKKVEFVKNERSKPSFIHSNDFKTSHNTGLTVQRSKPVLQTHREVNRRLGRQKFGEWNLKETERQLTPSEIVTFFQVERPSEKTKTVSLAHSQNSVDVNNFDTEIRTLGAHHINQWITKSPFSLDISNKDRSVLGHHNLDNIHNFNWKKKFLSDTLLDNNNDNKHKINKVAWEEHASQHRKLHTILNNKNHVPLKNNEHNFQNFQSSWHKSWWTT